MRSSFITSNQAILHELEKVMMCICAQNTEDALDIDTSVIASVYQELEETQKTLAKLEGNTL